MDLYAYATLICTFYYYYYYYYLLFWLCNMNLLANNSQPDERFMC